jgi:hypothetical protein
VDLVRDEMDIDSSTCLGWCKEEFTVQLWIHTCIRVEG